MKGNKLVEQVDKQGNITIDYDISISPVAMFNRIKKYFPKVSKDDEGMICGEYNDQKYAIRAKNITYLGNPHPEYKKRIQIPDDLQTFYKKSKESGRKPILLGVYTHGDNELFCEFNIEDFIDKKAHNSSAHVYTSDLAAATVDGIFQKIDYFGNKITVFKPEVTKVFLDDLFSVTSMSVPMQPMAQRLVNYRDKLMPKEVVREIENFFTKEDKIWNGIDCYRKMIAANYRNKYQPEWAGFYLEYEFESYIEENELTDLVTYAQDKTAGGIDLDLYFPTIECYGDLKAHSDNSRGIQGNDWDTVNAILDSEGENNHIYYIVCEHSTVKDSECGYTVTEYWNRVQNKENLMSYAKRMKNRVELKKMYILDINPSNKEYLTMFKQGVNSNGKLRAPKIMIEHDKLDKFVIAEINL